MPEIRVHEVDVPTKGVWSMRGSTLEWRAPNPHPKGYAGASTIFDPFPAYSHNLDAVRAAALRAQKRFAPLWDVDLYVTNREEVSRFNGHSNVHESGHYEGEGESREWVKHTPAGVIVLSGKRVPPHPAMTRYLVAHEYGHNVEYMIAHVRGAKHLHDDDSVIREYAKVRDLPAEAMHHGDGGTWHDSATEILACDFRILILGAETEFWPHAGIPRPEEIDGLQEWWDTALDQVRAAMIPEAAAVS